MSENLPQFDRAEYITAVDPLTISSYEPSRTDWEAQRTESALFTHALLYGIVAAIVGSALYAAFTIVTHIVIGYAGLVVGLMIGKAIIHSTHGIGGRKYQIAAAVLTYISISMANVPIFLWQVHASGRDISHPSFLSVGFLVIFMGLGSPLLALKFGLSALIDLFILFIAIRTAWGLTADKRVSG
jgi:hypothetical protein